MRRTDERRERDGGMTPFSATRGWYSLHHPDQGLMRACFHSGGTAGSTCFIQVLPGRGRRRSGGTVRRRIGEKKEGEVEAAGQRRAGKVWEECGDKDKGKLGRLGIGNRGKVREKYLEKKVGEVVAAGPRSKGEVREKCGEKEEEKEKEKPGGGGEAFDGPGRAPGALRRPPLPRPPRPPPRPVTPPAVRPLLPAAAACRRAARLGTARPPVVGGNRPAVGTTEDRACLRPRGLRSLPLPTLQEVAELSAQR